MSSVSSSKRCSEQPGGAPVNVGGGALLVDARTPSTFLSKKRWKSEALTPAGEGMLHHYRNFNFLLYKNQDLIGEGLSLWPITSVQFA